MKKVKDRLKHLLLKPYERDSGVSRFHSETNSHKSANHNYEIIMMMKPSNLYGRSYRKKGERHMEDQSKAIVEGKPLEYPEIVQDTVEVEFPEITDFVRNMKLKSGIFGFQKEDVYEKMQQLNKMYQSRAQQMRDQNRGQLKQMRKQQQEELEDMKARLAAERAEEQQKLAEEQQAMKEKVDAEQKEAYEKMQEQIAAARIEIRREMQAQMDEKTAQQKRELTMISEELERLNERFLLLKTRIVELAEQE